MRIIDGSNCILGRLSVAAAKAALNGEDVSVLNAGGIVVTGTGKKQIMARYRHKMNLRDIANPEERSYKFSRRPDILVRRTIWGMLPHTQAGRKAYKRVKVYLNVPKELSAREAEKVAELDETGVRKMTILEICNELGWKKGE